MNRATKSGFAREAQEKMNASYDETQAKRAMEWVALVTRRTDIDTSGTPDSVHESLADGSVLLELVNAIIPSLNKRVSRPTMAFKRMDQIGQFLTVITDVLKISGESTFQTTDLYEKQNMTAVIRCLEALGRKCYDASIPVDGFGPKESEANKRNFTEQQLKEGQNVIGLQMGSNKGASQAGQNFGKARHIVD